MKKLRFINYVLAFLFAVLCTAAAWIYFQPSKLTQQFQKSEALFDSAPFQSYERGVVEKIIEERIDESGKGNLIYQNLEVRLQSKKVEKQIVRTEFNQIVDKAGSLRFKSGDKVLLGVINEISSSQQASEASMFGEVEYVIIDKDRIAGIIAAASVLIALAGMFGRKKGLMSILGLAVTALILISFTAPQMLYGKNAVLVALISAGIISISTMLIAHGFNLRTKVSIVSTHCSLVIGVGLSYLFVSAAKLFGLGQSDAFLLQTGYFGAVDLKGLLLAGLIISQLGILDDVTAAQTATVEELANSNSQLTSGQIYRAAMSVGREHIASLINTLILVYAGAALPLFLLLVGAASQPFWVMINSENIAEEIIRAIAGSSALIIAVPISTLIATQIFKNKTAN